MVSPPQSSLTRLYSVNSVLTRSGLAPGLSILFIATIIGTPAAWACSIASFVCGITPSSDATTRTTISVICAPLALISVNAACPGVSIKVIVLLFLTTWYAPICCVIPPASPVTTWLERIVSKSVVFPWSTCPIIVTIAGRLDKSSALSSTSNSSKRVISVIFLSFNSKSYSIAISSIVSRSNAWVALAIIPIDTNNFLTSSVTLTPSPLATSITLIPLSKYKTWSSNLSLLGILLVRFSFLALLFLFLLLFFLRCLISVIFSDEPAFLTLALLVSRVKLYSSSSK